MKLLPYYKYVKAFYKWITNSFSKNRIISLFRQNIWAFPVAIIILMFIIGLHYSKDNRHEYFGSYANARMQGAIDILSINVLDPVYRINLIRDVYLFENPAFRDAIINQLEAEDSNPDDVVKTLKVVLQTDLNNINDVGSECEDCAAKITDALETLNSKRISSIDKLDIVKKINMYDPPRFTQIMDASNYSSDPTGVTQLSDLIAYLRINVSNPNADIPVEAFSVINPLGRQSNTKSNFEAVCEILHNNSIPSETKLDKIKDIHFFENPDYRSTIDNSDTITESTVNSLINIINNDVSHPLDDFSKNKMLQALQMLNSNGLSPEEKIRVLNMMDIYSTADYIYIMNPQNYSNDADAQVADIKAHLDCPSVRRIQQEDLAAALAAAIKFAEDAFNAAKKLTDDALAAARNLVQDVNTEQIINDLNAASTRLTNNLTAAGPNLIDDPALQSLISNDNAAINAINTRINVKRGEDIAAEAARVAKLAAEETARVAKLAAEETERIYQDSLKGASNVAGDAGKGVSNVSKDAGKGLSKAF